MPSDFIIKLFIQSLILFLTNVCVLGALLKQIDIKIACNETPIR